MNVVDAIVSRRTAHLWLDEKVPETILDGVLAAAHMAPCHRHTWPWRFTIPGVEARQSIFELGVRLKAEKTQVEVTPAFRDKIAAKMLNPSLVVVSQVISDNPMQFEEDYAACACAIQNMCLAAQADGFYSKWSTGGVTRHEETYTVLAIPSATERIIGFVWIGRAAKQPMGPNRPD